MQTKKQVLEAAARGEGCLGRAADDEPVFIVRGQDVTMPNTLEDWANRVERLNNGNNEKTLQARRDAMDVLRWQSTHPTKVPD